MNMKELKVGDYVKTKKGIKTPDSEYQLMDGWQGKVTEIQKEARLVEIEWDTQTLLDTSYEYLHDMIKGGYDHELIFLTIDELELTTKRPASAEEKAQLEAKIYWIDFYDSKEKNKAYGELFKGISISDDYGFYQKWEEYLSENLKFPFMTEVAESERGGLKIETKIKLLDLNDYEDMYGVFGIGKYEMGSITTPICNLEAVDKKSKNYELLRDYVVWFANR